MHRMLLESRSPFFKGMLESNMAEAQQGRYVVRDMLAPVVKAVLFFIYTGGYMNSQPVCLVAKVISWTRGCSWVKSTALPMHCAVGCYSRCCSQAQYWAMVIRTLTHQVLLMCWLLLQMSCLRNFRATTLRCPWPSTCWLQQTCTNLHAFGASVSAVYVKV